MADKKIPQQAGTSLVFFSTSTCHPEGSLKINEHNAKMTEVAPFINRKPFACACLFARQTGQKIRRAQTALC